MDYDHCATLVSRTSEVLALYLFGSQARGEAGPGSDVDMAVLLAPGADPWNVRLELGADLSEALRQDVDLIVMGEDLDLTFRVLREGRRLYAREHDRVCSEEATLASMYYDFQPFLKSYLTSVAQRFGGG